MAWRLTVDPCDWVVTGKNTCVPFEHPIGTHELQQPWNPFVDEQSPSTLLAETFGSQLSLA